VEAAEDRVSSIVPPTAGGSGGSIGIYWPIPLVGPCVVEVAAVAPEEGPKVSLAADEHVVEAVGARCAGSVRRTRSRSALGGACAGS